MKPDRVLAALTKLGAWLPDYLPVIRRGESEIIIKTQRAAGLISCVACLFFVPKPFVFLIAALAYLAGTYTPHILLASIQAEVKAEIDTALPDFVDLMTVLVEAGIDLTKAFRIAAEKTKGALRERLDAAITELELGLTKQEALRSAAAVSPSDDLKAFAGIFLEADRYGAPIAVELRAFADDVRDKQLCQAREEAQKLPIKMLFPLVFMILPAFILLTVGPLLVTMM